MLEFEGNRALVKGDAQERTITISVAGPIGGLRRLLCVIRSDFERIHADFPKLSPLSFVPLPNDPSDRIPYDELCAYENSGIYVIPRISYGKVIKLAVKTLLSSVDLYGTTKRQPIKAFISYSHLDDALRAELDAHLKLFQRLSCLDSWHDRRIVPGVNCRQEIDDNIKQARLILLLVSSNFLGSDYCYEIEMKMAMQMHSKGEATVVPIIVRDYQWEKTPFGALQVLPQQGKPVRNWHSRDSAWRSVADGLEKVIAYSDGFRRET